MSQILWLGMDVHKNTISIAVFGSGPQPLEEVQLPNEPRRLKRFLDRWAKDGELRCCYEASGAGYVIQRAMREWGYACEVIAPSLIPQRRGNRRKHDRYDARELGLNYRAGALVPVRVPSEAEEQIRDVVRLRGRIQKEILQSRHCVLKFLARRGLVFVEGKHHWTKRHWSWLRALLQPGKLSREDHLVLSELIELLDYKISKRDKLDAKIEEYALEPYYRERVQAVECLRGFQKQGAMVLVSEIGDFRRFAKADQFMSFVGLIPSEDSSGERQRRGSITKAGNSRCRHVLIQAAWTYARLPRIGPGIKQRQEGAPESIVAHSWKAQQRLHDVFRRVSARRGKNIAVVAVARELAGFVWAVMCEVEKISESSRLVAAA